MSTPAAPDKEQFVTSLARGLAVLRSFASAGPELTLTEVAAATDLSPAVARRFLLTLVQLGYVKKVDRKFVLTPQVMELGAGYPDAMNLAEVAQPHLQDLRDETGDSVSLTTLVGTDVIHLSHMQTAGLLRFAVTPGSRVPAYVSATGRAMLAFQPEERLAAYFAAAELVPRTPHTVTTEPELRERLERVRRDGYALVADELDFGITVLGVPLFNDGVAIAGISCATTSGRQPTDEFLRSRLPLLQAAASALRRQLDRFPALVHSLDLGV